MTRTSVHLAFGLIALAAAAATAVQGLAWRQATAQNIALAAAATPASAPDAPGDARAVRLARAIALARSGALDDARKLYGALVAGGASDGTANAPRRLDPVARLALFDLANMELRSALSQATGTPATETPTPAVADAPGAAAASAPAATATPSAPILPAAAQPLVELAKQRLRDLLRDEPGNWDARYTLELALRLAPEERAAEPEANNEPVERRRVMLRGMDAGELP